MAGKASVTEIVKKLGLQPHPAGGYFRENYRSNKTITLPNGNKRSLSTSIYFLMESGQFTQWHRLPSDELCYFHGGSSITIHEIDENGVLTTTKLGNPILEDAVPQHLINGGDWFAYGVSEPDSYSILGCVVSPGFDFEDFQKGEEEKLVKMFPQHEEIIRKYCHRRA